MRGALAPFLFLGALACTEAAKKPSTDASTTDRAKPTTAQTEALKTKKMRRYLGLPVPADFVESAAESIHPGNYRDVLDQLERDYATQ